MKSNSLNVYIEISAKPESLLPKSFRFYISRCRITLAHAKCIQNSELDKAFTDRGKKLAIEEDFDMITFSLF